MLLTGLVVLLASGVWSAGEDDLVKDLPGLLFKTNFKTYSGYVNANAKGTWKMHYTITESKSNPDKDPLLVWFNGGPGCSSLGGLFEELGPFYVNRDTETLFENPYAWNAKANVLYLESPIGVGFSYNTEQAHFTKANDDQTLEQNYAALVDFFKNVQPKYANRTFYLSGESYAGIYIPMLTDKLIQEINNNNFPNANFAGAAIGNGFMNVRKLLNALVMWSAYHGRVSIQKWNEIKSKCLNGADPDEFDFSQYTNSSNNIDYVSNGSECGNLIDPLITQDGDANGFDQYNFYQECYATSHYSAPAPPQKRSRFASPMRASGVDLKKFSRNTAELINRESNDNQWAYFCWSEDAVTAYLNRDDVQTALNIPDEWKKQNNKWADCREKIYTDYKLTYHDTHQFFNRIIANAKKPFRFLIYNGDIDTVCNYLGDAHHIYEVANNNHMTSTQRVPWFYSDNNQLAGYVQTYSGGSTKVTIDLLTVKGAGHMVPVDRAGPGVQMISNFVNQEKNYTMSSNFNTTIILSPMKSPASQLSIFSLVLAAFIYLL